MVESAWTKHLVVKKENYKILCAYREELKKIHPRSSWNDLVTEMLADIDLMREKIIKLEDRIALNE